VADTELTVDYGESLHGDPRVRKDRAMDRALPGRD
jgi:hypothetical protein